MLGKADPPILVTSNLSIPGKYTLALSTVVFCACEIMLLSAVLYTISDHYLLKTCFLCVDERLVFLKGQTVVAGV